MRNSSLRPLVSSALCGLIIAAGCACPTPVTADDLSAVARSAMADAQLARAKSEVERLRPLVERGALPPNWLHDAEIKLADAEDQEVIIRTFYGKLRVQDLTEADGQALLDAANRRVARQEQVVAAQQKLVEQGILARVEAEGVERELDSRRRTLWLAQNRVQLMHDFEAMAAAEARLASTSASASLRNAMIRYDGQTPFRIADLPSISEAFERRFGHVLPVSAIGETALHQSLGLDHRERVDVALNPEGPEGLWLRSYLEQAHIPYLAFRIAVPGAATAPHIHIGAGSTRLAHRS